MPAPAGPPHISTTTSPSATLPLLMAWIAASSVTNTFAGPTCRYTPYSSTREGSMAVLLITEASGARLPTGKQMVEVKPFVRAPSGVIITSSGSMPSIDFAGKTGTAQLVNHSIGGNNLLTGAARANAWFVGMAPRRNPDIVVAVLCEHGGWGATAAALQIGRANC